MSRRAWFPLLAVAGALAVPAAATPPAQAVRPPVRWLSVPVEGGGTIPLAYRGTAPAGVHASRVAPKAGPQPNAGPADTAPPPTDLGTRPGEESAQFPADAPDAAGTIASIAGGRCEGYPAREATIAPAHVTYDRSGRLYWVDVVTQGAGEPGYGSSLVRMLDRDGRVHTIGSVLPPVEGRSRRQVRPDTSLVSIVPDEHGGVYLNVTVGDPGVYDYSSGDVTRSNSIVHLAADGTRALVVGGLPSPGGPYVPGYGDGDPVTATGLRQVEGWTFDRDGNIYLADAWASGFMGTRIRFANRSAKAVTFYRGTPQEVTVQPGRIGTIAGFGSDTLDNGAGYLHQPSQPARTSAFYEVPRIVLHRVGDTDVLYFISTRWGGWQAYTGSEPALIHAINLFSPTPVVVNGQPVDLGYARVVAGNVAQPAGYGGDGGPAVAARFGFQVYQPVGDFYVARDGSLYIADSANHRIRVVSPLGLVTTIAGTGVPGFNAEGAPALVSNVWLPTGIVEDPAGRPVFSDFGNARIRRIETDGRLVTIAGRGPTACGDGHLATGRDVYEGAYFGDVSDTAYDSVGRLYVADSSFKTIRRILPSGRIDLTVGRSARCAGRLYSIEDLGGVDPYGPCPFVGAQSTDGPLADLRLGGPMHIRVDSYDNLVVSDIDRLVYVNLRKQSVSVLGVTVPALATTTLRTFGVRTVHVDIATPNGLLPDLPPGVPPLPVGGGSSVSYDATIPLGDVALDSDGTAYVSDPLLDVVYRLSTCNDVRILTGTGHAPVYAGQGDGGPAGSASIAPHDLDIDRSNRLLYVVDAYWASGVAQTAYGARVRAVNLDTKAAHPSYGVAVAPGTIETVAGTGRCGSAGFGCAYGYGGPAIDAALGPLATIALSRDGSLYVGDTYSRRVGVVFPDGRYYGIAGPWREKRDGAVWLGGDEAAYPSGYLGDGGRALDAWFSWSFGADSPDGALTVDPRGGLLLTDGVGRVRRIRDVAHTQLRTGAIVPGLPQAGVGFSELAVGIGPSVSDRTRGAVARPDLVETTDGPVLVGAAGAGRGCATWQVRRNADGHGHDAVEADGNGQTAAFPLGGSDCAATATASGLELVTGVRARDGAAPDEVGLVAATATAPGAAWTPEPVVTTDRTGGLGLGAPSIGAGVIAYPTASGGLGIASRTAAGYVAAATPVNAVRAVGDVVSAGGRTYVGFVSATPRAAVVQVATATAPAGPWTVEQIAVATDDAVAHVGAPSLAVDRAGTVYAAWSDQRSVYLAHRTATGAWSAAARVSALFASTLPTVTAGDRGHVALAFFASARPRSDATDPYAYWYAATAATTNATAPTPSFDVRIASAGDVLRGALCDGCPPPDDTTSAQSAVATCALGGPCPVADIALGQGIAPGRVRVRLAPDGGIGLAFGVASNLTPDGMAPGVGYVRSCGGVGLVAAAKTPACSGPRARTPVHRPPSSGPGVPPVPPLPTPTNCSPRPPAYASPPVPRRGAPRPGDEPLPRPAVKPPPAIALLPPLAIPELVLPEGHAPAANSQLNQVEQAESSQVHQANAATGLAASEEDQEQTAEQYAFAALTMTVAMLAALAASYELRRRRAPQPVRID